MLNNPLRYTDPSGENWWEVIGYLISTYILTANANGGELNPTKWTGNATLNALSGIASSAVSAVATTKLNNYIENFNKPFTVVNGTTNEIEVHTYVSDFGDAVKDNINPINLLVGMGESALSPFTSGKKIADGEGSLTDWLNMAGPVGQTANMAIGIFQTGEAAFKGDGYAAGSLTTQLAIILLTKKFSKGAAVVESSSSKIIGSGTQYSVAFETEISSTLYPGKGAYSHFKAANTALFEAMNMDANFAKLIKNLGIDVPKTKAGTVSPNKIPGWVWHHDIFPGKMQLVPEIQHTNGSPFWNTLHPNGAGGMSLWGGGYRKKI